MAEATAAQNDKQPVTAGTPSAARVFRQGVWLRGFFGYVKKTIGFDFVTLNIVLIIGIAGLSLYFVKSVLASIDSINRINFNVSEEGDGRLTPEGVVLKEKSFYMESIRDRDIFKMGPKKPSDDTDEIVSSAAVEATKSLRLVGISWSDNPDAIIEDERTKQTHFVKKGGMVGDIRVESVLRDKVILRVGQESIELR